MRHIACLPTASIYGEPTLYLAQGIERPIRYGPALKETIVPLDQVMLQ